MSSSLRQSGTLNRACWRRWRELLVSASTGAVRGKDCPKAERRSPRGVDLALFSGEGLGLSLKVNGENLSIGAKGILTEGK